MRPVGLTNLLLSTCSNVFQINFLQNQALGWAMTLNFVLVKSCLCGSSLQAEDEEL